MALGTWFWLKKASANIQLAGLAGWLAACFKQEESEKVRVREARASKQATKGNCCGGWLMADGERPPSARQTVRAGSSSGPQ